MVAVAGSLAVSTWIQSTMVPDHLACGCGEVVEHDELQVQELFEHEQVGTPGVGNPKLDWYLSHCRGRPLVDIESRRVEVEVALL